MSSLKQLIFTVPPNLIKFAGRDTTPDNKMMAARGTLPLPPDDLVIVLFALTRDDNENIRNQAIKSLTGLPQQILKTILLNKDTHPLIIDFICRSMPSQSEVQESIALNKATHDETIAYQSSLPNKKVVEIISNNQIRILRCPEIVDALSENPLTGQAVIERILTFVEMEHKRRVSREPKKTEVRGEGMEVEIEHIPDQEPEIPAVTTGQDAGAAGDQDVGAVTIGDGEEFVSAWSKMTFGKEMIHDHEFESNEQEELISKNLYKAIQNMKISEKIKLAMLGNKEARGLLIRDSNRIVASAVLKSPRMTESEIDAISKSRSVSDDVIRQIASNKEWIKNYQIKVNLVNNAKTPISESLKFMNHLRDKELRALARSRNVPGPVSTAARKLVQKREEKGKAKKPAH